MDGWKGESNEGGEEEEDDDDVLEVLVLYDEEMGMKMGDGRWEMEEQINN